MKKNFVPAPLVLLVYFLGIVCWRILRSLNSLSLRLFLSNFFLLLGGLLGWFLLKFDRLVDAYFLNPQTQLSHQIRYLVKKRQFFKLFGVLENRKDEQKNLVFRSALFQTVWLILAFFALSSTTFLLGKGLVLGLGLHLLFDEWKDVRLKGLPFLRDWLFWQIKRKVSLKEAKLFLWLMTGLFFFLTLLML